MFKTNNEGRAYEHSLNHSLEFFSKAGSLFDKRETYYTAERQTFWSLLTGMRPKDVINEESALALFQKSWIVDQELSFRILLWLRDCRGGAGNRSGFRSCINWLAHQAPEWVSLNIKLIPWVGRWDDLTALYDTPCEKDALVLWSEAIKNNDGLACKWASRKDNKLRKFMSLDPRSFRRVLVAGTKVVESKMCAKLWGQIEYPAVPSVAMARYTRAFNRQDEDRFKKFKESVEAGEEKINASVLFPHDCVRTALGGDPQVADLQFAALPNFMSESHRKILCLCDTSGSMSVSVSGRIQAVHISMGLSLYCSDRLDKDNPFYRKFIQFESESKLTDWNGMKFSDVVTGKTRLFDGACGSTNVQKALETILGFAKMFNVKQDQMPDTIMIVSDMQFDQGIAKENKTEIEESLDNWVRAGYRMPTIIYWNTAGYLGSPATANIKNVALVSGFSPAILRAIFSGEDISPISVLMRAIEKYKVATPAKNQIS